MINTRKVEENIKYAVEVLKERCEKQGGYPETFKGYVSSLGASMIQGHWQAAIAFYSNSGEAQDDRTEIPAMILEMIKRSTNNKNNKAEICENSLLEFVLNNPNSKKMILEHLVALKLALNLFQPLPKSNEGSSAG